MTESGRGRVLRWSLAEARTVLAGPDLDRAVADGKAAAVAVATGDDPADDVGRALARLPVVAVAAGAGSDAWDVVAADPGPVLAGVEANPDASVIAAQTLRRTAVLGLDDGLLVESLAYAVLQAGPEHRRWLHGRGRRVRRDRHQRRVTVTDRGDAVTVTLDRPRLFNLFDAAMRDELADVLRALGAGSDRRPVVLTGASGAFCAGGDPAEFGTVEDPVRAHLIRSEASVAPGLAAIAPRVTALVDGACAGAGVELAAFCGTVRATRRVRFRLPELAMGLICGTGGMVSIPRRIGRQRTLEWLLTGAELDSDTARRWGLVDELVDETADEIEP